MMTVEVLEPADRQLGYFDELELGQAYKIGSTRISRASALAFANVFDPFYFHIDEDAAKRSMFGGLIVSGLQTLSAIHALSIRGGFLSEKNIVCGAGIDELRFMQPVRPDDSLAVTAKVIELKPPRRTGGHGVARLQYWVHNQNGVLVSTFIDNHVLKLKGSSHTTRSAAAAAASV
jgi:acyl dehydratase